MMTRNEYETRRFAIFILAVVTTLVTVSCVVGALVSMIAH